MSDHSWNVTYDPTHEPGSQSAKGSGPLDDIVVETDANGILHIAEQGGDIDPKKILLAIVKNGTAGEEKTVNLTEYNPPGKR